MRRPERGTRCNCASGGPSQAQGHRAPQAFLPLCLVDAMFTPPPILAPHSPTIK